MSPAKKTKSNTLMHTVGAQYSVIVDPYNNRRIRNRWLYFKLAFLLFLRTPLFSLSLTVHFRAACVEVLQLGVVLKHRHVPYRLGEAKSAVRHTQVLKKAHFLHLWLPYTRTFNKDAALKVDDLYAGKACKV